MKNILFISIILLFTSSLQAIELRGKFYQGNFILGKVEPGTKVFIDKKIIKVSNGGHFAFGLSKDRKNDVKIEVIKTINDFVLYNLNLNSVLNSINTQISNER